MYASDGGAFSKKLCVARVGDQRDYAIPFFKDVAYSEGGCDGLL